MTTKTRQALLERSRPSPKTPAALSPEQLATLDAITRRLLPQDDASRIDLAGAIDHDLSTGPGDGWRHADLPPDLEAYARGLARIDALAHERHAQAFVALEPAIQDSVLRDVSEGRADSRDFALSKWFGDLLAAATEVYMAHPATLARMGYDGMAFLPRWSPDEFGLRRRREPSAP